MKIDVYGKYKVIQKSRASVRVGEDEFEEQSFEQTYESMEGSVLERNSKQSGYNRQSD